MQNYENFAICTSNALDYTCAYLKVRLSEKDKRELLDAYKVLPAFDDVTEGPRGGYNAITHGFEPGCRRFESVRAYQ